MSETSPEIDSQDHYQTEKQKTYVIFAFAGQGQQTPDMFMDWYDYSRETNSVLQHFHSITKTTYGNPFDPKELEKGPLMQPANVTQAVISCMALRMSGVYPDETHGSSLGEYGAIFASGAIKAKPIISLSKARGDATQSAIEILENRAINTGMVSVSTGSGNAEDIANQALKEEGIPAEQAKITNFNWRGQVVVSGDRSTFSRIVDRIGDAAKSAILDVDGAYHHFIYMRPAAKVLQKSVNKTHIKVPEDSRLYSSTTVGGLRNRDGRIRTRDEVANVLIKQLFSDVNYGPLILSRLQYLNNSQILRLFTKKRAGQVMFYEISPSPPDKPINTGVLISSAKRIVRTFEDNNIPIDFRRISRPSDLPPDNSR